MNVNVNWNKSVPNSPHPPSSPRPAALHIKLLTMNMCEILFNVDLIELISEISLLSLTIKFKLKVQILAGNWDENNLVLLTLYCDTKLFMQ